MKIANATIEDLKSQEGWIQPSHFEAAKTRLILKTERFTRPELQRALRSLAEVSSWDTDATAEAEADEIAELLKESLTIDKSEFDNYLELNKKYSHPLTLGVPGHA